MDLINDTDLNSYIDEPEFHSNVRNASDFMREVIRDLDVNKEADTAPGLNIAKIQGLFHFQPGEVTVWAGYNGHRKSMMTSQAALNLAAQGERVLIVSLEMLPWRTMSRMTRQATGLAFPAPTEIENFNKWTDGKMWLFDHVGRIVPAKVLALCRYFADKFNGTHVFLDSWMMICGSEENMDEQKQFSTDLCRLAQATGLHVHVVAHCRKPPGQLTEKHEPTRYDIRGSASISDQAANTMIVWMNKAKFATLDTNPNNQKALQEPCAVLKCDKQRQGAWEGKVALWFDPSSLRFCDDRTSAVKPIADFDRLTSN